MKSIRIRRVVLEALTTVFLLGACQTTLSTTAITATVDASNTNSSPSPKSTQVLPVATPTENILSTIKVTPSPDVITLDNAKRVRPTGKTFWSSWRNAELVFRPDTTWIVEPLRDGGIVVRDFHTEGVVKSLPDAGESIEHIIVSPDGRRLAVVNLTDETISVWDLDNFSSMGIYPFQGHLPTSELTPLSGSFSHTNRFLVVSGCLQENIEWNAICWYSDAIIYDLSTKEIYEKIAGYQAIIDNMAFSPDDKILAIVGQGSSGTLADILVWDIYQNKLLSTLKSPSRSGFFNLGFNCNGDKLATITTDNTLVLWDTDSWQSQASVDGNGPNAVGYSPIDCSLFVTTDGLHLDGLTFWNADTLEQIFTWEPKSGKPYNLAISPDGRKVFTWSDNLSGAFRIQEWYIP